MPLLVPVPRPLAWICLGLCAVASLAACGDPPLTVKAATDVRDVQFGGDASVSQDATGQDEEGQDAQPQDSPQPDDSTGDAQDAQASDVPVAGDAPVSDAPDATQPPDAQQPVDVGVQPFTLVGSDPADGTMGLGEPFTVTLQFSTAVKPEAATPYTFAVTTHGGSVIPGKFTTVDDKVTFTATAPVPPASRVQMKLGTLVQAQKGASLQQSVTLRWYTAGLAKLEPYEKLAARYAPRIRQGIKDLAVDAPRSLDSDGNWDAADDGKNLATSPALARVGWSVIETQSHYFVTYVYFWPHRNAVAPGVALDNDAAGAMVTVAKWPQEHPVALTTYFKAKADEQMWLWVTQESGWPKTTFVRGVLPQAQLFPPADPGDTFGCEGIADCTPHRYPAYLSAGTHQSCLGIDAGDSGGVLTTPLCATGPAVQATLKWVDYVPGQKAEAPATSGNPGPVVTYALQSLHDQWWPHRDEAGTGGLWTDALFVYEPPEGRPQGPKLGTGSKFLPGGDDYGRPPWAWQWKPASNASYYQMPRGTPFYDPAWALRQRLGGQVPAYDAQAKSGLSLDFCLHPFWSLDLRDMPACQNGLQ